MPGLNACSLVMQQPKSNLPKLIESPTRQPRGAWPLLYSALATDFLVGIVSTIKLTRPIGSFVCVSYKPFSALCEAA